MKKLLLIFFYIPALALAQFEFLPINADYTSFSASDSLAYIEVYVSVFRGNLLFSPLPENQFKAQFSTELIMQKDGETVHKLNHDYESQTGDTSRTAGLNQFIDVFTMQLPFGSYSAIVRLEDKNATRSGEYQLEIVTHQPEQGIYFSQIELCSEIRPDDSPSLFHKNGLRVVPNARRSYDFLQPLLYFYVEINNLPHLSGTEASYTVSYNISDADGKIIRDGGSKQKPVTAATQAEINGLNVIALPAGVYHLNVEATEPVSQKSVSANKKFRVYKPDKNKKPEQEVNPEIADVLMNQSEDELKQEFAFVSYLAGSMEKQVWKGLTEKISMQKFLTEFWKRRADAAQLPLQIYRERYLQNVEFVNANFGSVQRQGWMTDRGRVFLLYGQPNEIERNPSTMDRVPFDIWHFYNLEGGVTFIFADLTGFGIYELIHSSYSKELQDPDWERKVYKSGTQVSPTLSY